MSFEPDGLENHKYQRWLAESLVTSLGYDGAVSAAQRMAWYGVLGCLLNLKGSGTIDGPGLRPADAEAA